MIYILVSYLVIGALITLYKIYVMPDRSLYLPLTLNYLFSFMFFYPVMLIYENLSYSGRRRFVYCSLVLLVTAYCFCLVYFVQEARA